MLDSGLDHPGLVKGAPAFPRGARVADVTFRGVPLSEALLRWVHRRARKVDAVMDAPCRVALEATDPFETRWRRVAVHVTGFAGGSRIAIRRESQDAYVAVAAAFDALYLRLGRGALLFGDGGTVGGRPGMGTSVPLSITPER